MTPRKRFLISKGDEYHILEVEQISHIATIESGVKAYLHDGNSLTLSHTMNELEQELDRSLFFRANRQFIVNVNSISRISNYFNSKLLIRLKGYPNVEIVLSRERSSLFKEWLDR